MGYKMFQTLVHLVMQEVGKIAALNRTPRNKQRQFSLDICLIACGVRQVNLCPTVTGLFAAILPRTFVLNYRCAYLVDAVVPHELDTFSGLLQNLRDKVWPFETS